MVYSIGFSGAGAGKQGVCHCSKSVGDCCAVDGRFMSMSTAVALRGVHMLGEVVVSAPLPMLRGPGVPV